MFSIYRLLRYILCDKTNNVIGQKRWKFSWRRAAWGLFSFIFLGWPSGAAKKLYPAIWYGDSLQLLLSRLETWHFYQACVEKIELFRELIYEFSITAFLFIILSVLILSSVYSSSFPDGLLKYLPVDTIYALVTTPEFFVAAFIALCTYDWVCFLYSEGECSGKFLARVCLSTTAFLVLCTFVAYCRLYSYNCPLIVFWLCAGLFFARFFDTLDEAYNRRYYGISAFLLIMAGLVFIIFQLLLWSEFLAERQIFFDADLKILPPFDEEWTDFLFMLCLFEFLLFRGWMLDEPVLFCALVPGVLALIFHIVWALNPIFASNFSWYIFLTSLVVLFYCAINSSMEEDYASNVLYYMSVTLFLAIFFIYKFASDPYQYGWWVDVTIYLIFWETVLHGVILMSALIAAFWSYERLMKSENFEIFDVFLAALFLFVYAFWYFI